MNDVTTDLSLRWSDAWTARRITATSLELSAGADRRVVVDGLDDEAATAVFARDLAPVPDHVRARLLDLGVLVAGGRGGRPLIVRVVAVDAAARELATRLRTAGVPGVDVVAEVGNADLDVVLRCGVGAVSPDPARPRLVVDVGASRVLVVGPFVHPGSSACETCLDRVSARRWDPAPQPARPDVARHDVLIAAVIGRHVELIAEGRSPLVNATTAMDLDAMTAVREPVLMSPRCPTCAIDTPPARPQLPWEAA